jgi:GR25 family glycosyltransferase involved in LPS biosynthesis
MNSSQSTQKIPIFVISLARAPDRRAAISSHLKNLGLDFEIVDAVDGAKLPDAQRKSLLADGVNYVPGVIGCYLSHIQVYEKIVKNNIPVALILEDDARLSRNIVPAIRTGIEYSDFEYCLLDCDDVSEDTPVFYDLDSGHSLFPGFTVYETNVGPALLHAYLMTQEGAKNRVAHAWPIYKPVDIYSHLSYSPRILVCVSPKGAFVSEHSRQSFTSDRNETSPLRLKVLRRFSWFYVLKDWLKLRPVKGWFRARVLVRSGVLAPKHRWRPMPTGRNILNS